MSQLPLPIGGPRRGEGESLLIHAGNREAIAMLRGWRDGPAHCFLLVGPRKSGRSLMGALFAAEAGAIVIEDAQACEEQRLFNLWNETRDANQPLLLIVEAAPPAWKVALPDLRTRLAAAAIVPIHAPDEVAAAALIAHGLERAGSAFAPDVPEFVARRTARCYEAIDGAIARLNASSLASGHKISIASARRIISEEEAPEPSGDRTTQGM